MKHKYNLTNYQSNSATEDISIAVPYNKLVIFSGLRYQTIHIQRIDCKDLSFRKARL